MSARQPLKRAGPRQASPVPGAPCQPPVAPRRPRGRAARQVGQRDHVRRPSGAHGGHVHDFVLRGHVAEAVGAQAAASSARAGHLDPARPSKHLAQRGPLEPWLSRAPVEALLTNTGLQRREPMEPAGSGAPRAGWQMRQHKVR